MSLPVFDRDDSQNICFIRGESPDGFIRRNVNLSPGDIVFANSSLCAGAQSTLKSGAERNRTHEGLELYTIGRGRA